MTAAGLEFFPLCMTAQPGRRTQDHLHRGGPPDVNNKPTYLSRDGLDKLRTELEEMVSVKRSEVANRIHDAKEHGDLSENAEYHFAKEENRSIQKQLAELEARLRSVSAPIDLPYGLIEASATGVSRIVHRFGSA